jgi:hypothetical protein
MSAKPIAEETNAVSESNRSLVLPSFIPGLVPEKPAVSDDLKVELEAYHIPALLETQEAEMDAESLGGIPVLISEGVFDSTSDMVDMIELNSIDDDDDFAEDEFEDLEDDEDEEDDDWDEDYEEDEEEEEEEEDEDEIDDFDDEDELDDLDDEE